MIIVNEKYGDGFKLDEYKGTFSLVACKQGKDGKEYPEWLIMQDKDRRPKQKENGDYMVRPVKVLLGNNRDEAIRNLTAVLNELQGHTGYQEPADLPPTNTRMSDYPGPDDDSGIPF